MTAAEELCFAGVAELAMWIRERELSAVELFEAVLERAASVGGRLNCFIDVRAQRGMREAARADSELAAGRWRGPLHGLPISLKDNIAIGGEPTTAGSAVLRGWRAREDATVVARLREAGAILFAKCNLYEFAYGAPSPAFGPTQNPWRPGWSCAGSSSGSAAAVAAGLGVASIATDTSGSTRIPAAMCGVVGLKPSYGAVSRRGVIPVSANLDHVGPIARTVADCAAVLGGCGVAGAGGDVNVDVRGTTIAMPRPQPGERLESDVDRAVDAVAAELERQGASRVERELPDLLLGRATAWTITGAEAAEYHHDRLRSVPERYAPDVRTLLETGEMLPASAYVRAQRVRARLTRELSALLEEVNAVLLPAVAMPAYEIGAREVEIAGQCEPVLQGITRYTALFAVTGHPAVVFPCGMTADGRPLAAQLVGRRGRDLELLRIARAYERATEWHARRPPVGAFHAPAVTAAPRPPSF